MVTQGRAANKVSPTWYHRAGIVLMWVGILTWAPFILMRANGIYPSIFWFLPFHLTGVLGGSRLRALARKQMGKDIPVETRLSGLGCSKCRLNLSLCYHRKKTDDFNQTCIRFHV